MKRPISSVQVSACIDTTDTVQKDVSPRKDKVSSESSNSDLLILMDKVVLAKEDNLNVLMQGSTITNVFKMVETII
jgi:hypothetical protein